MYHLFLCLSLFNIVNAEKVSGHSGPTGLFLCCTTVWFNIWTCCYSHSQIAKIPAHLLWVSVTFHGLRLSIIETIWNVKLMAWKDLSQISIWLKLKIHDLVWRQVGNKIRFQPKSKTTKSTVKIRDYCISEAFIKTRWVVLVCICWGIIPHFTGWHRKLFKTSNIQTK